MNFILEMASFLICKSMWSCGFRNLMNWMIKLLRKRGSIRSRICLICWILVRDWRIIWKIYLLLCLFWPKLIMNIYRSFIISCRRILSSLKTWKIRLIRFIKMSISSRLYIRNRVWIIVLWKASVLIRVRWIKAFKHIRSLLIIN